jgi:hypothetical protein
MKTIAWIAAAILLAAAPATAQFYRYLDAHGSVRFTDDINQVPEAQRAAARSYVESRTAQVEGAERKPPAAPAEAALAAIAPEQPPEQPKDRLEEMKKQLEAQYQALLKEKEALAKEKDTTKTRQQVIEYNKRVEAFNQSAGDYEARGVEVRKAVEEYNAHILEENARTSKPAQN